MRRFVVLATAVSVAGTFGACRISLEDDSFPIDAGSNLSASCMAAQTASDLTFLETRVYATACTFSGCHNGASDDAGMMDLRSGMSLASLVNKPSKLEPAYMLVVPGQPTQSYLLMMVQHLSPEEMTPPADGPPIDIGFMPQNTGGKAICMPKREAIERWIVGGALP
ncbi:MAG: hypothetical protein ACKV2T_30170 [Kofleriaceae bacterium]